MRALLPSVAILALILPRAAAADRVRVDFTQWEKQLSRGPYDSESRQQLVDAYSESGEHGGAYYHAAWLTWLAAREYADSEAGEALLHSRDARERAARRGEFSGLPVIIDAVRAKQLLYSACLSGTVAQQASRLRGEIVDMLARAEQVASEGRRHDPVVRIALAHMALSLDDAIRFESGRDSRRARLSVLRKAASRASSVAARLPESPGPPRLMSVIRSRMAELDNRPALWELALKEAERAYSLDAANTALLEVLWTLNLRAGNWEAARAWQARLEAHSAECSAERTNRISTPAGQGELAPH
jgi:hypothetical protein